jgi:Fur family peroxide stress response transcriptional regulator
MIYEDLRPRFDTLSLATVYNTLDALARLGAVNLLGEVGSGDSVRYDADTAPHVNLACVRCQRIIDLPSEHVHHLDREIEETSGYALLGARVLYYGVCPECQAAGQQGELPHGEHTLSL